MLKVTPKQYRNMKKIICKVSDNWMGSLESADLSVTSPTGKTLTLRKIKYWNKSNDMGAYDISIIHIIRDRVSEWIRNNDKVMLSYPIGLSRVEMAMFKSTVEKVNGFIRNDEGYEIVIKK